MQISLIASRAESGRAKPALIRVLEVSAKEVVLLSLQLVSAVAISVLFALSIPQLYTVVSTRLRDDLISTNSVVRVLA